MTATEGRAAWLLLSPLAVLYIAFFATPFAFAAVESFTMQTRSGLGLGEASVSFAGLSNYARALGDPAILAGFWRVFLIGIIQVPVMMVLATFMALLFDSGMVWARQFFQTSAFLPHAIPGVISALLWSALYLPQVSPIVKGLEALNIPVNFLGQDTVLFSIMNVTTWEWTGYNMIILYAALQSIPRELLESAKVDGAGGFRTAIQIKLPLIVPGLVITVMFSVIGALQQFAVPAVLQSSTNAVDSRFTPNLAVYNLATNEGEPGMAAALSLVIAVLALICSAGILRIRDRRDT